jgi:quercetin dioxygenase-like cupin family protein
MTPASPPRVGDREPLPGLARGWQRFGGYASRVSDDIGVRLDVGEQISLQEHREVRLLLASESLTITWSRYGPGERGPDPHVHREHTDAFYVLEGDLTFTVGPDARTIRLEPGGFASVPANVVHSFANESGAEARWLNFHTPDAGFAAYLRALRDGTDTSFFDSFGPPADGGLPASEVLVVAPA